MTHLNYLTLNDYTPAYKRILLRIDINTSLQDNIIQDSARIQQHAHDIKLLLAQGMYITLLAHQGRYSKDDCISLKQHIPLLKKYLPKNISIKLITHKELVDLPQLLKNQTQTTLFLIENIRFLQEETQPSRTTYMNKLLPHYDLYLINSFSTLHRHHASMTPQLRIPILAGPSLDKELQSLRFLSTASQKYLLCLGGAKPSDLLPLIEHYCSLNKADHILCSGILGWLFLSFKYDLGITTQHLFNYIDKPTYLRAKKIYNKYASFLVLPVDGAYIVSKRRITVDIDDFSTTPSPLQDIGPKTLEKFKEYILHASLIYFKGPPGNYVEYGCTYGTQHYIKLLEHSSAFKFLGGGDSAQVIQLYSSPDRFDYVSTSGGALVTYLADQPLPGLDTLIASYHKYYAKKPSPDILVFGANTIDYTITVPYPYNTINVGDKLALGEDVRIHCGGGGINAALCFGKLGSRVQYHTKLNKEAYPLMRKECQSHNVAIDHNTLIEAKASKSFIMNLPHDRIIFTYKGCTHALKINPSTLPRHHGAYFSSMKEESFLTCITVARHIKQHIHSLTCCNPSFYLIESEPIDMLLEHIDVLILNLEEAKKLTSKRSITSLLKHLHTSHELVVITNGKYGAHAIDKYGTIYFTPALEIDEVDCTGAGDTFASTCFYFYLHNYPIEQCLHYATHNAAQVIQHHGAHNGQLLFDELIKR